MYAQLILTLTSGLLAALPTAAYSADTKVSLETVDKIAQEKPAARGVLTAKQTANLAAGMSARILKAPYKPGQSFKRGALLIAFDCERLSAEKRALEEAKAAAGFKHDNIKELLFAGAAGALEETLAATEARQAGAELAVTLAKLKDCIIYAPYAGIVQEKHISAFDTPALNAPLLSIIRAGTPEIKLIAPSLWLTWLKPGTGFEFTIDETGKTYSAQLVRTGASVDPVSQTIELTARFKKSAPGAMAGMSGVASFVPPAEK